MKKLIIVAAARSGWGHIQAAHNLFHALASNEFEVMQIDVLDYAPLAIRILFDELWQISSLYMKPVYRFFHNRSAHESRAPRILNLAWWKAAERIRQELLAGRELAAFVSTHPVAAHVGNVLKAWTGCKLFVVATDFFVHRVLYRLAVDKFFVPPYCEFLDSKSDFAGKTFETGIPIAADFAELKDKETARRHFGLDPDRTTILVSFGGLGLTAERYMDICETFFQKMWPCQFLILAGKNASYRAHLEKKYASNEMAQRVHILDFHQHVADCYAAADLFVGKAGGLSTSEALATGIPILLLGSLPGQEEINAKVLVRIGVAVQAKSLCELEKAVENMLFNKEQRISSLAEDLGRPHSSREIATNVLAALNEYGFNPSFLVKTPAR